MKRITLSLIKAIKLCCMIFLALLATALSSCNKEALPLEEEAIRDSDGIQRLATNTMDSDGIQTPATNTIVFEGRMIEIKEGRLIFQSLEDIAFVESRLLQSGELGEWFDQQEYYQSANEAYLALSEEAVIDRNGDISEFSAYAFVKNDGGNLFLGAVIDDPAIRHLANERGILQVGDEVYQIFREMAVVANVETFFSLTIEELLNSPDKIRKIKIKRRLVSEEHDVRVNIDVCQGDYENKRRVKGELEERSSLFSQNVNCIARTKHFKKGAFGIYYGEKADQLSQFGCLSVNGNNGICFEVDKTLSNRQEIDRTFFSGDNAFISGGNTVRHYAREGTIDGECFTQAPE